MPIYEFQCTRCEARFEELLRSPRAAVSCPACGGEPKRLPSLFGVRAPGGSANGAAGGSSCAGCSKGSCAGCH